MSKRKSYRLVAWVLTVIMIFGLLPLQGVFAEEAYVFKATDKKIVLSKEGGVYRGEAILLAESVEDIRVESVTPSELSVDFRDGSGNTEVDIAIAAADIAALEDGGEIVFAADILDENGEKVDVATYAVSVEIEVEVEAEEQAEEDIEFVFAPVDDLYFTPPTLKLEPNATGTSLEGTFTVASSRFDFISASEAGITVQQNASNEGKVIADPDLQDHLYQYGATITIRDMDDPDPLTNMHILNLTADEPDWTSELTASISQLTMIDDGTDYLKGTFNLSGVNTKNITVSAKNPADMTVNLTNLTNTSATVTISVAKNVLLTQGSVRFSAENIHIGWPGASVEVDILLPSPEPQAVIFLNPKYVTLKQVTEGGPYTGNTEVTSNNVTGLAISNISPSGMTATYSDVSGLVYISLPENMAEDVLTTGASVTLRGTSTLNGQPVTNTIEVETEFNAEPYPQQPNWAQIGRAGHISSTATSINFWGHQSVPFCTGFFSAATDGDYRNFTFTIREGNSDWHTLEGTGFIFNADISGGLINGYAILFGRTTVGYYRLTNVSTSSFAGATFSGIPGVSLIQSVAKPSYSQGTSWFLRLLVSPGSLSFYKYDNPNYTGTPVTIFRNIPITTVAGRSGYGPFASFVSHGCSSISTSSFENLRLTIHPNTPPRVTAPNVTINRAAAFDPMSGVFADDNEDGVITENVVIIENNLNRNVPGLYTITYRVTDMLGLTGTTQRTVRVLADAIFTAYDQDFPKDGPTAVRLSGIGFRLYDSTGAVVETPALTNANGQTPTIVGLAEGTYTWEMITPHYDYIPVVGRRTVVITAANSTVWPFPIDVPLERKKYDLEVVPIPAQVNGIAYTAATEVRFLDTVTYNIRIINHSNVPAQAGRVEVTLPDEYSFDSTKNPGWTRAGNTLTYTAWHQLPVSGMEHVPLHLDCEYYLPETTSTLTATVPVVLNNDLITRPDENTNDNTASCTVKIVNIYDMAVDIEAVKIEDSKPREWDLTEDPEATAKYNDIITYKVTVTNLSNQSMIASKIKFTFPEDIGLTASPEWADKLTKVSDQEYILDYTNNDQLYSVGPDGASGVFYITFKVNTIKETSEVAVKADIIELAITRKVDVHPDDIDLTNNFDEVTVPIYNEPIKLTKKDVEKPDGPALPNSHIEIYNEQEELIYEGISDSNGEFWVREVYPGKYFIHEIKAPDGFWLSDYIWTFEKLDYCDLTEESETIIYNVPTKIVLTKLQDGTDALLSGAVYEIYDMNGKKVAEGVTGSDGTYTQKYLKWGAYYFVEKKAPYGHLRNPRSYEFMIEEKLDDGVTGIQYMYNKPTVNDPIKKYPVTVTTVDDYTSESLAGAYGEIYDRGTGALVGSGYFDEKGELHATDLLPGDYYAIALTAPDGYKINVTPILFTIEKLGDVSGTTEIRLRPFEVLIRKIDEVTLKPLAGARIAIANADGKVLAEELTDQYGLILLAKVMPGDYTIYETVAPKGYILDPTPQSFTVAENGTVIGVTELTNKKAKVEILKIDGDSGETLAGAVFGLYNENGALVMSGVSGEDGLVIFNELPVGVFEIRELEAPEGYIGSEETVQIIVDKDWVDPAEPFVFENFMPIPPPAPVKTGYGDFGMWLFMLLLGSFGALAISVRKAQVERAKK